MTLSGDGDLVRLGAELEKKLDIQRVIAAYHTDLYIRLQPEHLAQNTPQERSELEQRYRDSLVDEEPGLETYLGRAQEQRRALHSDLHFSHGDLLIHRETFRRRPEVAAWREFMNGVLRYMLQRGETPNATLYEQAVAAAINTNGGPEAFATLLHAKSAALCNAIAALQPTEEQTRIYSLDPGVETAERCRERLAAITPLFTQRVIEHFTTIYHTEREAAPSSQP